MQVSANKRILSPLIISSTQEQDDRSIWVSQSMKAIVDRTVLLRTGGGFELTGKVGAGIACGGFRNGGQELTLQSMHTFFLQQDMFAIADGPRYSHSGAPRRTRSACRRSRIWRGGWRGRSGSYEGSGKADLRDLGQGWYGLLLTPDDAVVDSARSGGTQACRTLTRPCFALLTPVKIVV